MSKSRFHVPIPGEMGNPSMARGADMVRELEQFLGQGKLFFVVSRQEVGDIVSYVDYLLEQMSGAVRSAGHEGG